MTNPGYEYFKGFLRSTSVNQPAYVVELLATSSLKERVSRYADKAV
jgi:hypothetical protein